MEPPAPFREWPFRYAPGGGIDVTDEHPPSGAAPNQEDDTPAQPPVQEGDEPREPPAATPGRGRAIVIIGGIVVFLAVVLFLVRNNISANDLQVGDCFNIPEGTSIQTVEKQPCTDSHTAEVIFVGEYTGDTYPISLSLDSFIEDRCVPAFESYIGRAIDSEPKLAIAYFYPSRDTWDNGDRTITCYGTQPDESPMTGSLKA
jgi:Septum formation